MNHLGDESWRWLLQTCRNYLYLYCVKWLRHSFYMLGWQLESTACTVIECSSNYLALFYVRIIIFWFEWFLCYWCWNNLASALLLFFAHFGALYLCLFESTCCYSMMRLLIVLSASCIMYFFIYFSSTKTWHFGDHDTFC